MHALPFISFVFDVVNVLALHLTFFIIFSQLMFLLSAKHSASGHIYANDVQADVQMHIVHGQSSHQLTLLVH